METGWRGRDAEGAVPIHTCGSKKTERICWLQMSPQGKERGVPDPHQNPKPRVPVLGREVPLTSGCKRQPEKKKVKLSKTKASGVLGSSS